MSSNRLGIGQSLLYLMQNMTNTTTNIAVYQLCKLGAIYDPTTASAFCEIMHFQGKGGPVGSGGNLVGWRIEDEITFLVRSGFGPYETDSDAAEIAMLTAQDVVLPTIRQHYQLPNSSNITTALASPYRVLVEQADRSTVAVFPNGHSYRLWSIYVTVSQQYGVTVVNP